MTSCWAPTSAWTAPSQALNRELNGVRTGRAHPSLIESLPVDYYGAPTPLKQLGTINAPEPRMLTIQVWDRALSRAIEKAIQRSDLGLNPAIDGQLIRLPIPPLTEHRRKDLVKLVHNKTEESRVAVRNVRRHAHDELRKAEKDGQVSQDDLKRHEEELQKTHRPAHRRPSTARRSERRRSFLRSERCRRCRRLRAGLLAEHLGDLISPLSGGRVPRHVAVIMDGNGRWAKQRGLPRAAGHRAGTENIRRVIERFADHGVQLPHALRLQHRELEPAPARSAHAHPPAPLLPPPRGRQPAQERRPAPPPRPHRNAARLAPAAGQQTRSSCTAATTGMVLNICFSYGGRDDILLAVQEIVRRRGRGRRRQRGSSSPPISPPAACPTPTFSSAPAGDQRISNFLLWQCAYAELYFTDTFWPDFGREDIDIALADYGRRKRKFGGLLPEDEAALHHD